MSESESNGTQNQDQSPNPVKTTMAETLMASLKQLDGVVINLVRAVDADKGLSAQLALKELKDVKGQVDRILNAIAEMEDRLDKLDSRMNNAAALIKPLLAKNK